LWKKGETLAFVIYDAHAAEVAQMWPRVLLVLSELGGIINSDTTRVTHILTHLSNLIHSGNPQQWQRAAPLAAPQSPATAAATTARRRRSIASWRRRRCLSWSGSQYPDNAAHQRPMA